MRWRAWLTVCAGWTALALFFAISSSLTYSTAGRPPNWALTIGRALSEWWLWALLTPVVVSLARRYPVERPHGWRNLAVHFLIAPVLALAKAVADRAIFAWLSGFWIYLLLSTVAQQIVVYGTIVAAAQGMEYYRRSREREQLETRLAKTRLQLLSMQLQPHFLFNTLNTIAELVHDDPETAETMIAGLSELLRRTLHLGHVQEIPLAVELDLLTRYVEIQKARFGERLQVRFAIDEAVRTAAVPALLLQPLVENAIRHGLSARRNAGRIDVEAALQRGIVSIAVTDDGVGTGPGRLDGVGLNNTRARLETLYPERWGFEMAPVPGGGTRVSVTLPFRPAETIP